MSEIGIRLSGLGGQGIVLSSVILGQAASVYNNLNTVQTQTYGSDMRGGDVCTEVIISDKKIIYPIVNNPDILIAIAQKAFEQHIEDLKENGILITDKDLVNVGALPKNIKHYYESFNGIAIEEFGNATVSNMIMLGFFVTITNIIPLTSLEKTLSKFEYIKISKLNKEAIKKGEFLAKNLCSKTIF
jgi:2-oxoglutarate ferredoxin oxidoreductase subunit gamma